MGQGLLDLSCCVSILIVTPFESHVLQLLHTSSGPCSSFLFCHLLLEHANAPNENKCILLLLHNRWQRGTFFVMTTYLNNVATEQNLIIIEWTLTRCLPWNNTAESSTLIPEEAVCIHPSIRLLQLLRPAVPSAALLMIHLRCCIRIQRHKEEILRRWRVLEIETFEH